MSIIYFVAPYERQRWIESHEVGQGEPPSELRIDPEDYASALTERWPLVDLVLSPQVDKAEFPLTWTLPSNNEHVAGMTGKLYRNLQVVSFSRAPKEIFYDYMLWHRLFVPALYTLYLFDSSSVDSNEITSYTNERDIAKFCGYQDDNQ